MIDIILDDLNKTSNVANKDIAILSNYFFSIESWNYYEIILFGNSLSRLPFETAVVLSKELINRTSKYSSIASYKKLILQILINISIICYKKNELITGYNFLSSTNIFLESTSFYEKTIIHYLKGVFIRNDDKELGDSIIKEAMDIMKILDSKEILANYQEFYEFYIK